MTSHSPQSELVHSAEVVAALVKHGSFSAEHRDILRSKVDASSVINVLRSVQDEVWQKLVVLLFEIVPFEDAKICIQEFLDSCYYEYLYTKVVNMYIARRSDSSTEELRSLLYKQDKVLGKQDRMLGVDVVKNLASRTGDDVDKALITATRHDSFGVREAAFKALDGRKGAEVKQALIDHLTYSRGDTFIRSVELLVSDPCKDVTDAFMLACERREAEAPYILPFLAMRKGKPVTDFLFRMLSDRRDTRRGAVILALGMRSEPKARKKLIALFLEKNCQHREIIVKALSISMHEDVTSFFAQILGGNESHLSSVESVILKSLAKRPGIEVTRALVEFLVRASSDLVESVSTVLQKREGEDVNLVLLEKFQTSLQKNWAYHNDVPRVLNVLTKRSNGKVLLGDCFS